MTDRDVILQDLESIRVASQEILARIQEPNVEIDDDLFYSVRDIRDKIIHL